MRREQGGGEVTESVRSKTLASGRAAHFERPAGTAGRTNLWIGTKPSQDPRSSGLGPSSDTEPNSFVPYGLVWDAIPEIESIRCAPIRAAEQAPLVSRLARWP
jgi:hypothetical protein